MFRPFAILALLAFAHVAAGAEPTPPVAPPGRFAAAVKFVAECAGKAPANHRGLDALEGDCPGLEAAMRTLGLGDALAAGSAEKLSGRGLGALIRLHRPRGAAGPDPAHLAPLVRDLSAPAAPQSWWQRLKDWVQRVFGSGTAQRLPWLDSWLEKLAPGRLALKAIGYGLMALVVIAAAWIVVRELRAAGVRGPRWRSRSDRTTPVAEPSPSEREGLDGLPLAQRPRLLFRLAAARLAAEGRLPDARGRTHRELRDAARLEGEDRATWQQLARLAERQVYAGEPAPAADEPLLERAGRLWT